MKPQVLNDDNFGQVFKKTVAGLYHDEAKNWVQLVAKNYLLATQPQNAGDTDWNNCDHWNKEFLLYSKKCKPKPLINIPEILPAWAEDNLQKGEPVYVFNSVQPKKREFWQVLEKIVIWFNRNGKNPTDTNYAQLSFPEAAQKAAEWRIESEKRWKEKHGA